MKTGFLTDDFSTLAGLAAVAYGSVDSFREVQNQIIQNSPTGTFDSQRPSDIFTSFIESESYFVELITESLYSEYTGNEEFADYVDERLGAGWTDIVEGRFMNLLRTELDSSEEYQKNLKDCLSGSLNILFPGYADLDGLADILISAVKLDNLFGEDISLVSKIAGNNPRTKISTPPPNTVVSLKDSTELDKDYRGVSFVSGYLTPQSYYSEIAYPGFDSLSSMPSTFKDSIFDGLVGYLSGISLERIFNPTSAESIGNLSLSPNYVLSESDIWSTASALGDMLDIPGLTQTDRDIYEISLIGPRINGFLTFDSKTMSNGDFIDTSNVPKILNSDKEGGLPMSSRNFSSVF